MITLLVLLAITLLGWVILSMDDYDVRGIALTVCGGLPLVVSLLLLPICHMETHSQIQQFRAVEATLQAARASGDELEGAAFRMKVAEMNQWLASTQYWASTDFWIFFPSEINELEPME